MPADRRRASVAREPWTGRKLLARPAPRLPKSAHPGWQVSPLPEYGGKQVQVRPPTVLVHWACGAQPLVRRALVNVVARDAVARIPAVAGAGPAAGGVGTGGLRRAAA